MHHFQIETFDNMNCKQEMKCWVFYWQENRARRFLQPTLLAKRVEFDTSELHFSHHSPPMMTPV